MAQATQKIMIEFDPEQLEEMQERLKLLDAKTKSMKILSILALSFSGISIASNVFLYIKYDMMHQVVTELWTLVYRVL